VAVVAMGLAAAILLPAAEMTRHTARAAWDYGQTVGFSLSPAQWIGLLIPAFFGRGPQFHWGLWPRVEVGYVGILPLILAALALTMRREKQDRMLAGLAAATMLFALGVYSLPHGWLTALVPGLGQLRAPARFVFVFDFAVAALAASGLDALLREWDTDARRGFDLAWCNLKRFTFLTWGIAVPLAYLALLLGQGQAPATFAHLSVTLISVVFFATFLALSLLLLAARRLGWAKMETLGALAVILIFIDLGSSGAYNDLGREDPARGFSEHAALVAFLQAQPGPFRIDTRTDVDRLWQPDMALVHGLEDVYGVANPLTLSAPARYWEGLGSRSSPLYDFLNIGFVIARKDVVLDWEKFALAFDGDAELNVYRNRRALPRAFLVHRAVAAGDAETAWAALHAPGFDPATTVVVEGGSALEGVIGENESVGFLARGLNDMELDVRAATPGYLVLSEVYYPGWRATLDGRPARILRANYAFRAVEISEAGTHRVRLWYAPASFQIGAALSLVTLLLLVGGAVRVARGGSRLLL
ncbi:MAG: YfhO family protein, partial [Anaerolineae bacterium]|nr:YfhO family protein [Anaerolineae bacterium]